MSGSHQFFMLYGVLSTAPNQKRTYASSVEALSLNRQGPRSLIEPAHTPRMQNLSLKSLQAYTKSTRTLNKEDSEL